MGTLAEMQATEKRLVEVDAALSGLLEKEDSGLSCWATTQLNWALRVLRQELSWTREEIAKVQERVAAEQLAASRFVALSDAAQEVVGDVLDAKKAREEQHPPRPCKDDKAD